MLQYFTSPLQRFLFENAETTPRNDPQLDNTMSSTSSFKKKHPFEKRKEEADRILAKYPQRIPVICEKDARSKDIPNIDRQKYLVPDDLSVANFIYVIRKRIKISPDKNIYLFVNNKVLPASAQFISTLYEKYKDEDGFLYITYAGESTFG